MRRNGQPVGGGGGPATYTGSGSPEHVQTGNPPSNPGDAPETYWDSANSKRWVFVGSTSNNYDWINITDGWVENPRTRFGSGCAVWQEPRYGDGVGYTVTGGKVSQVQDFSQYAHHVVQATDANRPIDTPTGGPNGGPCITLDTTAKFLSKTGISGVVNAGDNPAVLVVDYLLNIVGRVPWDVTFTRGQSQSGANSNFHCTDDLGVDFWVSPALSANTWRAKTLQWDEPGGQVRGQSMFDVIANTAKTTGCKAYTANYIGTSYGASGGKMALVVVKKTLFTDADYVWAAAYVGQRFGMKLFGIA